MSIFGPKPRVNPLAFFRSRISEKTFSWRILPKKKKLEKWLFLDQNHGLTPLQKSQFSQSKSGKISNF